MEVLSNLLRQQHIHSYSQDSLLLITMTSPYHVITPSTDQSIADHSVNTYYVSRSVRLKWKHLRICYSSIFILFPKDSLSLITMTFSYHVITPSTDQDIADRSVDTYYYIIIEIKVDQIKMEALAHLLQQQQHLHSFPRDSLLLITITAVKVKLNHVLLTPQWCHGHNVGHLSNVHETFSSTFFHISLPWGWCRRRIHERTSSVNMRIFPRPFTMRGKQRKIDCVRFPRWFQHYHMGGHTLLDDKSIEIGRTSDLSVFETIV